MNHETLTPEQEKIVLELAQKMSTPEIVNAVALLIAGIQIGKGV